MKMMYTAQGELVAIESFEQFVVQEESTTNKQVMSESYHFVPPPPVPTPKIVCSEIDNGLACNKTPPCNWSEADKVCRLQCLKMDTDSCGKYPDDCTVKITKSCAFKK
jgi:hypothetical protein